uniref:Uncharacterized protein n=1 Tax=Cyprinus carpio TaxID=7962 RepID=A0A8C1JRK8_CYPCA
HGRTFGPLKHFLSISLSISNAHTVDFYTRDVWSAFMCVSPEEVLCAISSSQDRMRAIEGKRIRTYLLLEKENTTFGLWTYQPC